MLFLFQLQPEQLDCGAAHLQHPLSILQPLKATPVFRAPGLSSVAVASVSNYTVVFLGTASGRLLKVGLGEGLREEAGRAGAAGGRGPVLASCPPLCPALRFTKHFHICSFPSCSRQKCPVVQRREPAAKGQPFSPCCAGALRPQSCVQVSGLCHFQAV